MFGIGDKIVYPAYGAGVIETIEEKEVLGEKKKYYILRIPIDDMRVMIPMDNINGFGIRSVISYNEFENIMNVFKQYKANISDGWGKRYRYNTEKIRSGNIYNIAEVVKDLWVREEKKGLSPGERKILDNAMQIMFSELIVVTGLNYAEVLKIVKDAIFEQSC